MTVDQAIDALRRDGRVLVTVVPGHVLRVSLDGTTVMSECIDGWCAGVVEPVCQLDSEYLRQAFLADRGLDVELPAPPAWWSPLNRFRVGLRPGTAAADEHRREVWLYGGIGAQMCAYDRGVIHGPERQLQVASTC